MTIADAEDLGGTMMKNLADLFDEDYVAKDLPQQPSPAQQRAARYH